MTGATSRVMMNARTMRFILLGYLMFQNLVDDDFKRLWQGAGAAVGAYGLDAADVEAASAAHLLEHGLLLVGEAVAVGDFGHGVTHVVEEGGFEAYDLELNVEQSVVNGSADASHREQCGACEAAAALIAGVVALGGVRGT